MNWCWKFIFSSFFIYSPFIIVRLITIIYVLICFVYLFINMHVLYNMSEAFVMKDESTFISILHAFFIKFYPINTLTIKHLEIFFGSWLSFRFFNSVFVFISVLKWFIIFMNWVGVGNFKIILFILIPKGKYVGIFRAYFIVISLFC